MSNQTITRDTNFRAHINHTVKLTEAVTQDWELEWVDGEPKRVQVVDETVLDTFEPTMFCFTCGIYLTDFDVSVI